MGSKLVEYYDFAGQKGQLLLQIKLAMKTCMALPEAKAAPDSAENLAKFYQALKELVGDDPALPRPSAGLRPPLEGARRSQAFG